MNLEVTQSGRHAVRLAHGFALDGFSGIRRAVGLSLGPCLTFTTINLANNSTRVEPGHRRRPVSVYALHKRLNLPYETVRRYCQTLIDAGFCRRLDDGLIISISGPQAGPLREGAREAWRSTRKYVAALSGVGVEVPAGVRLLNEGHIDAVSLRATEHFLNLLDLAREAFQIDTLAAFVQIAVLYANTRAMVPNPGKASLVGVDAVPPDSERLPVTAYRVAKILGLPYETTRRQILDLQQAGLCDRLPSGAAIVPARVLARPHFMAATAAVVAEVERYLTALAVVAPQGRAVHGE